MDILSIAGTVLRRWYIAVPIVLLALVIAFVAESRIPAEFEASGSVLLANPELDPAELPLTEAKLDAVIVEVQRAADSDAFGAVNSAQIFAVDAETVAIEVEAATEGDALAVIGGMSDALSQELAAMQEASDVPQEERASVVARETEVVLPEEEDEDAANDAGSALVSASTVLQVEDPTSGIPNPFGASAQTIRVIEVALESDAGRQALAERAGREEVVFDITQDPRDVAPIVDIYAYGSTPQIAIEDFELIVDVFAEALDARQARAQVPESRRVELEVLATPGEVEDVSPPVSRVAAAILALGGLLALGLALLVDSIAARRRSGPGADDARDDWETGDWDTEVDEPRATGSSQPAQTS